MPTDSYLDAGFLCHGPDVSLHQIVWPVGLLSLHGRTGKDPIVWHWVDTLRVLGAAANTYRTVRIATDVRRVFGECQAAFKGLRELSLPALRTFQNVQLNEELQQLAERVALKGANDGLVH